MKVLLVSLNAKFIHSSLALRYIFEYCSHYKEQMKVLELTINHEENDLIKEIYQESPDVIGFSCYIWNMQQIKTLIPILKELLPQTQIILGGPEVSYDAQTLFDELPIDGVMLGEGEATWADYMAYLNNTGLDRSAIDGLIYREAHKVIVNKPRKPMALSELPFVYGDLTGLEHKIMYYEASRGCPFSCQYCLSSAEKGVRFMPLERVKEELGYFLAHKVKQIKFVDRTFNANKGYAIAIWDYLIQNDNGHTNFHFEIAAELIDEVMLDCLKDARPGLIQFEIGVQSTNPEVLKIIKRPMPFEEIKSVVLAVKSLGNIHQHLDLIAGLPKEDFASFRRSFNDVISLRPEQFQLGFLKLLHGSGLRRDARMHGIRYKAQPPYEVLYTKEVSFSEMLCLHQIEELLERYYNSERFKLSLEYLFALSESPFDFFHDLSNYWQSKGYDKIQHKKASYYLKLVEFAQTQPSVDLTTIKELVRLDWLLNEPIKEMPNELLTLEQSAYKTQNNSWLRDDAYMIEVLKRNPEYTARQRLRKMHIEWFSIAIEDFYHEIKSGSMSAITSLIKSDKPYPVLIDYTENNTCLFLHAEVHYDL